MQPVVIKVDDPGGPVAQRLRCGEMVGLIPGRIPMWKLYSSNVLANMCPAAHKCLVLIECQRGILEQTNPYNSTGFPCKANWGAIPSADAKITKKNTVCLVCVV